MELKYLSTSQVFINTGMRERSIAYSRLVDGNSRQDLDVEDWRKLLCSLENSTVRLLSPNPAIKPRCRALRTLNHLLSFYLSLFPSRLAQTGL